MNNYFLETFDSDGKKLEGPIFISTVMSCSYSGKKYNKAMRKHIERIDAIKPAIIGYSVEHRKFVKEK